MFLMCMAIGRPYATILWYKDGTEITNGSLTSIYNEQFQSSDLFFTSSILEVCSVGPENSGSYSCVANNFAGNDSMEFEVQVQRGKLERIHHTHKVILVNLFCLIFQLWSV